MNRSWRIKKINKKDRLTKEFDKDGIELSGGEKQLLTLARVLYRDNPVIILDEPSSALDPLAEYKFNQTLKNRMGNNLLLLISHRLSTTMFADKILMMKNGEIVEVGTHRELMNQNGYYAEMFRAQAESYRYENTVL